MRSGGRSKGTPNKLTTELRSMLSNHLDAYLSEQFITDWNDISARERVRIASTLIKLIVPPPLSEHPNIEDSRIDGINVTIVTAKEEIERLEQLR